MWCLIWGDTQLGSSLFPSNLVAAVSGEKVVQSAKSDAASASERDFTGKYESYLKKKDANGIH